MPILSKCGLICSIPLSELSPYGGDFPMGEINTVLSYKAGALARLAPVARSFDQLPTQLWII